jgi:outer membrane protein OmpA-like peptidoglycan-associated protein
VRRLASAVNAAGRAAFGVALAAFCALGALGAGCAGSTVRAQTGATAGLIATARDNGAQRCAPVELAMAESHNDFAQHELDEGNYHDARREAEVAETNAKLAIDKSPRDKCVDQAPPPPLPPPGPGDKDGDGLLDNVDKCPSEPEDKDGFQDEDGCPEPDNDADGILDNVDKCPSEPEDKDGFEDEDGCPDPDNDKDGFLDPDDKCPLEPGVAPDGCPKKYNLVVVTQTKIELKQTVFFDTNRATIKRVSFALLDDVAQALNDNPKITVEIQGHTDSQGNDRKNLKLSQKRADSVRTYLVKKGVTGDRLVPKGYGENVPIVDNRTTSGRAQNRRVEFVITAH